MSSSEKRIYSENFLCHSTSLQELANSGDLQQHTSTTFEELSLHKKLQWAGPTRIVCRGGTDKRVREQRCRPLRMKIYPYSFASRQNLPESSSFKWAYPRITQWRIPLWIGVNSTCPHKTTSIILSLFGFGSFLPPNLSCFETSSYGSRWLAWTSSFKRSRSRRNDTDSFGSIARVSGFHRYLCAWKPLVEL